MRCAARTTRRELAPAVVDAVHRVTTDPGRLTRRFVDDVIAAGISDAQLVELIGVVCLVMLVDGFAARDRRRCTRATRPVARRATRVRPAEAIDEGYFVPTIPYAIGARPRARAVRPGCIRPERRARALARARRGAHRARPDGRALT
jgi:hypothetical protein